LLRQSRPWRRKGQAVLSAKPFPSQAKARDQFRSIWIKQHTEGERQFLQALYQFFRQQAEHIAEQVRNQGPQAGVDAIFQPSSWDEAFIALATTELTRLAASGALTQWDLYGPDAKQGQIFDFTKAPSIENVYLKLPKRVLDAIGNFVHDTMAQPYWQDVNTTVRDDLANVLKDSIDQGDNRHEAAERVQEVMTDTSKERAERIVRTETTGALNAGHDATRQHLEDLGIVKGKEWLSIIDRVTRPEHVQANGQTVSSQADFTIGSEHCRYPGDVRLSAGQRVHCRCTVVTVLNEDFS
jgi:SPP1 gp7 family putative phage head morphogenesis protein